MINVKRVYEPANADDGARVLVDRLWPRGISKDEAAIDDWAKELAPSKELFTWFHQDKPARFSEFEARYQTELAGKTAAAQALLKGHKSVTLVTSVKDIEHSHIPTLKQYLEQLI